MRQISALLVATEQCVVLRLERLRVLLVETVVDQSLVRQVGQSEFTKGAILMLEQLAVYLLQSPNSKLVLD